jgi:hypothetical protein
MTRRTTPTACRALTVVAVVAGLAACSHAPEPYVAPSLGPVSSAPGSFSPSPAPPPPPPPPEDSTSPSPGFDESVTTDCAGHPSADQVASKVRAAGLVGGAKLTVKAAPVCAGTWQYTVFTVSGRGPLQVVTKGSPAALTLVTAGTNVCSTEVLAQAPPGIITVAQCGLGAPPAGL